MPRHLRRNPRLTLTRARALVAWGAIEDARTDPLSVTRDEADALTSRFNLTRGLTLGLLGGGVALTGVGVLLDAPVTPVIGLGQLGVRGSF